MDVLLLVAVLGLVLGVVVVALAWERPPAPLPWVQVVPTYRISGPDQVVTPGGEREMILFRLIREDVDRQMYGRSAS